MAFPKIGNMAPAFTLLNQDGEKVALKDFRDKKNVILYFYPRASTPGCTVQGEGLRDIKADLDKQDYVALGVSFDPVAKLKKFHDKYNFNFDLLSDEDHAIIDKYGCWQLKKFMGKENMGTVRTTFVIGKDGRMKHILDKFKTKTHHEDVIALLESLNLS